MSEPVIKLEEVGKKYRIEKERYHSLRDDISHFFHRKKKEYIWALKGVSFEVKEGEVVGIIGKNGAGKTTLLKLLAGITLPTEGKINLKGRVASLIEIGAGIHPELTGRENIFLYGSIMGLKKKEIDKKFDEIVDFAGIGKFLDTAVKYYSSGMQMRLGFSVASHLEPKILLVDEVLAVGDAVFQKKCLGKMDGVAKSGRTVLFVSHNMTAILNLCIRGILLDAGKIQKVGPVQEVVDVYINEGISLTGEYFFPDRSSLTDKVKFIAVRILGADNQPTSHVDLLKGFTLEIEYKVLQPVESVQIGFELWNANGVSVLCSGDLDASPEGLRNIRHPGCYRTSCFVPSTYLRPGYYWIDLNADIPDMQMLDKVNNAISFEVVDRRALEEFKLTHGRRSVIAPILSWNTKRYKPL